MLKETTGLNIDGAQTHYLHITSQTCSVMILSELSTRFWFKKYRFYCNKCVLDELVLKKLLFVAMGTRVRLYRDVLNFHDDRYIHIKGYIIGTSLSELTMLSDSNQWWTDLRRPIKKKSKIMWPESNAVTWFLINIDDTDWQGDINR